MKRLKNISALCVLLAVLLYWAVSCKRGLDYVNSKAISPANVWTDPGMIKAFLTDIYGGLMPKWSFDGSASDEGIATVKDLGNYQRGVLSAADDKLKFDYTYIDKCNYFLDQLDAVAPTVIDGSLKKQFIGEAKFWRAWTYWGMVSNLGGVPLILHTQNANNPSSLKVPRSKTSDCIAQIVRDLDSAALLLPANYGNSDFGRITKVAALGLKGRVLLWYASPLFNPSGDVTRWQAALAATKAAVDTAKTNGYGLLPNFRNIWYSTNSEMIMANQYYWPDHPADFSCVRAEIFTQGCSNQNQPLLPMLMAFPKRDGSPMAFDKTQLSNPVYNAQLLTDFYTNRDDRFYATVFCGGTVYPTPDIIAGQTAKTTFWNAWAWDAANNKYKNIVQLIYPGIVGNQGVTGFFDRKGLDTSQTAATINNGQLNGGKSYWVPMRFAELLMNYGECANEMGNTAEALNVLYQIRARAGITPGAGNSYGITASAQTDIRNAYILERQVEFAFENMRLPDLRRWRRYDILNSQGARHGFLLVLNPGAPLPAPTDNIMNPAVRANFSGAYVDNLDGDPTFYFNLDLNHWFYPLDPQQLSLEPNVLQQNKEWGGSFDPLQ